MARQLVLVFGVAACFPLLCILATPHGPQFEFNSIVFHHTTFFSTPEDLLRDPLANAPTNLALLAGYLGHYGTVPLAAVTPVALVFLLMRRHALGLLLFLAWLLPVAFQVIDLKWFPSRYVFPHMWACILPVSVALANCRCSSPRLSRVLLLALAAVMAVQSGMLVARPASVALPR